MIHEISRRQARLDTMDRPFLRGPEAELLVKEIEDFRNRVGGFHEPLQTEFRAAADRWLERARAQHAEIRAVLDKEPTHQLFRAGDPVGRADEAFVPRHSVLGELERQVMLATGCPGLVVYGRRRTGKSTLLRNLEGFLPSSVVPARVSMQDPRSFTSLQSLVGHLDRTIRAAVVLAGEPSAADLDGLFAVLDAANAALDDAGKRLLLAVDEYEMIDQKVGAGVFPEDLLATVRESVQTHRRIIWTFVGSHEVSELRNLPWTSYLVSARTVEVGPFSEQETRLLLTEPLRHSPRWPKDDPSRPGFEPGFWGDGGIERVHAEAGGWPHLVQLVAETIVDLLNDEEADRVDEGLFERALARAVVRGNTVFHELLCGESTLGGEWEYLQAFARRERQAAPGDEAVARSLRRRQLVVEDGDVWRLRVPLMGRWLRERG
jgi:hypothetical protein